MPRINAQTNHKLNSLTENILNILQDISIRVTITPDFSISHPDYQPLAASSEVLERLQQLPKNIQDNYLNSLLTGFIYGIYYNGSLKSILDINADTNDKKQLHNLENNTFLGVDTDFYEQLHHGNRGEGFFDDDWQVIKSDSDGNLDVKKGDLTLYIKPKLHLKPEENHLLIGDIVAIRMPKNLVQNGFYMAVGNAGRRSRHTSGKNTQKQEILVRVYFNLTPQGAVKIMENLTRELNAIALPFCFKALYNPDDYKRYDSAVLYIEKSDYKTIEPILKSIYQQHQCEFRTEVPLFTKILAPGLAIAEEPERKFSPDESFGLNRCHLVANGLLAAWRQGHQSPETKVQSILQQFDLVGLEWQRPYLNPHSEDIYGVFS